MEANIFKAGVGRVNVTPNRGTPMIGYYIERRVEGVLDDLEATALAFSYAEEKAVLISIDICLIDAEDMQFFKESVEKATGLPDSSIFIHATHTHTGPGASLTYGKEDELLKEYTVWLSQKITEVALLALADLKPARLGYGVSEAKRVAFIRRFRMKDGSVMTNPGVNNPDIKEPLEKVNEAVNVLRIDREDAESIVVVNFGNHPDTVGGSKISADWPGFTRRFVEKAIDNTKCIFFNGFQGDVNHVNVHPRGGDFNDMFHDFDGCSRGYGHARHIGRAVAGAVMQIYDKVHYVEVEGIKCAQKEIKVPSNKATEQELEMARKYYELHTSGKDEEIPFKAMELTTVVAEAKRMLWLENGPQEFPIQVSALSFGKVAMLGISGEPFTGIGRELQSAEGWDLVMPCCLMNGSDGYIPTRSAYEEGGYEARSSKFKAGVSEKLVQSALEILSELK